MDRYGLGPSTVKHFETIGFHYNYLNKRKTSPPLPRRVLPCPAHRQPPWLYLVGFFLRAPNTIYKWGWGDHSEAFPGLPRDSCKLCTVCDGNWGTRNSILQRSKCVIITNPGGMGHSPSFSLRPLSLFSFHLHIFWNNTSLFHGGG